MKKGSTLSEFGMALAYGASAIAIVAIYRTEIGELVGGIKRWYASRPKPTILTGKLAEDVREAANKTVEE